MIVYFYGRYTFLQTADMLKHMYHISIYTMHCKFVSDNIKMKRTEVAGKRPLFKSTLTLNFPGGFFFFKEKSTQFTVMLVGTEPDIFKMCGQFPALNLIMTFFRTLLVPEPDPTVSTAFSPQ